jgi:Uma2 family endonuclease
MAVTNTTLPPSAMTADEFLAWSDATPGLFELHDGVPVEITGQTIGHADVKFAAQTALKSAIEKSGLPCRMLPDGMSVRVSKSKVYKPDAMVYCGPRLPTDTREIAEPIIIIEVLSETTRDVDLGAKVLAYFSLPSVQHYIIIDPEQKPVIHQARQSETSYLTRLLHAGKIEMSPPGITIDVADLLDL